MPIKKQLFVRLDTPCNFYLLGHGRGEFQLSSNPMAIYGLILILSVVQSLFGVGILLFGTPILLIAGYEYHEILLYLLPASAALSWSQVWDFRKYKLDGGYRKSFLIFCISGLLLGMYLTQNFDLKFEIRVFVTVMLFLAFILRTSSRLRSKLQRVMKRRLRIALASMGLIHGLSNMGGSVLTPLVSSLYSEKSKVMAGVSFDYAFMASFQLTILVLVQGHKFLAHYLIGSVIALSVRYLIGKKVFEFTSEKSYQRLINGFILANAIFLFLSFK
jgi:uncharacterized membrane protein YfcA